MTLERMPKMLRAAALMLVAAAVPSTLAVSEEGAKPPAIDTSRIVSIGGDVTEILYLLGFEDRIVAVDTTSVFPPEALAKKPNVGYLRALSSEGVLSMQPSVIIASDDAGPPEVVAALKTASIPYLVVPGTDNAKGVLDRISTISEALGVAPAGQRLAEEIRAEFKTVAGMRDRIKKPARMLFLLSVLASRVVAGGHHTAADAMIALAGGENVAAAIEGYKPLSDEAAIELAPEYILVMRRQGGPDGASSGPPIADEIKAMRGLGSSPAARNDHIMEVDGSSLLQFGPRTPKVVRELMAVLYPELANDPATSTRPN